MVVKFIRLFSLTLTELRLAILHGKIRNSTCLSPIDGHRLSDDIISHMPPLKEFHFAIKTVCYSDKQMEDIVRSFQTRKFLLIQVIRDCH